MIIFTASSRNNCFPKCMGMKNTVIAMCLPIPSFIVSLPVFPNLVLHKQCKCQLRARGSEHRTVMKIVSISLKTVTLGHAEIGRYFVFFPSTNCLTLLSIFNCFFLLIFRSDLYTENSDISCNCGNYFSPKAQICLHSY